MIEIKSLFAITYYVVELLGVCNNCVAQIKQLFCYLSKQKMPPLLTRFINAVGDETTDLCIQGVVTRTTNKRLLVVVLLFEILL